MLPRMSAFAKTATPRLYSAARGASPFMAVRSFTSGGMNNFGSYASQLSPRARAVSFGGLAIGAFGIMSLVAAGRRETALNKGTTVASPVYSEISRTRVSAAYGYLASGLTFTAFAAGAMARAGIAARMAAMGPWASLAIGIGGTIGTMLWTMGTPYENTTSKHVAWLAFNSAIALSLSPLAFLGGSIIMPAAAGTAAVVGSLSLVGWAAPPESFLSLRPVLGVGLGVVFAASLGSLFFPAMPLLYNVSLYGGLGVFGLFVSYDTQKLVTAANDTTRAFDPINESLHIYMDTINIFVRLVQIMANRQNNKRR